MFIERSFNFQIFFEEVKRMPSEFLGDSGHYACAQQISSFESFLGRRSWPEVNTINSQYSYERSHKHFKEGYRKKSRRTESVIRKASNTLYKRNGRIQSKRFRYGSIKQNTNPFKRFLVESELGCVDKPWIFINVLHRVESFWFL